MVGYAGGTTPNPDYEAIGDHSEVVRVEFDPSVIDYRQLLEVFWDGHDPCRPSWSRQYRSVILYGNERQRRLAVEAVRDYPSREGCRPATAIEPLPRFFAAEEYHQKYYLKRFPDLTGELRAAYPDAESFAASTAAARLNGFAAQSGTVAQLERIIDSLGLSPRAKERVRTLVR
jgi:peptide-methionine (S)-S-oxide reductase